ncbi:MFS transporter [Corynebacterium casei]|uniref:MFS transporter n=1 Tax=Corynebacterium casei TaxID=160386 RepID=UPI00264936EB|nr:MFS transporter [Corynebacterium casei]MDN5740946.1 MFS transporter [Corynebacterium casei]MDN5841518.1 MFS transporter [Corynebacterium casei]MDN5885080.1 MFS transporter [Corynebacterium casei]MDN6740575.1 MFS transporter [Corynebacterium casei]
MQRNTRAMVAMLFVGLAIFSGLYSTQAMLPTFVDELGFTPTEAALTVSAATGALALCVVPLSILSERFGRGRLLVISAVLATILAFMVPLVGDNVLAIIAIRALQGAVLAGAPAVAMAWLSEELDEDVLPRAMGLYIAGNTLGGLTGRLIPTGLLEFTGWRGALLGAAVVSSFFAVLFIILLPKQRNFQPKQLRFKSEIRAMVNHWRNPQTGLLFVFAFLGMGAFVSIYNFITFRLIDRFGLPVTLAGLVFLMYLAGTWSSARVGTIINRYGHGRTFIGSIVLYALGVIMTLGPLPVLLAGMFIFTAGFFAAHSTASGWVGQAAHKDRAEASSMYLFCYYAGSSIIGAISGLVFEATNWAGFIGYISCFTVAVLVIGLWLHKTTTRQAAEAAAVAA